MCCCWWSDSRAAPAGPVRSLPSAELYRSDESRPKTPKWRLELNSLSCHWDLCSASLVSVEAVGGAAFVNGRRYSASFPFVGVAKHAHTNTKKERHGNQIVRYDCSLQDPQSVISGPFRRAVASVFCKTGCGPHSLSLSLSLRSKLPIHLRVHFRRRDFPPLRYRFGELPSFAQSLMAAVSFINGDVCDWCQQKIKPMKKKGVVSYWQLLRFLALFRSLLLCLMGFYRVPFQWSRASELLESTDIDKPSV